MGKTNNDYLVYGILFAISLLIVATLYYSMSYSKDEISESKDVHSENSIVSKSKMKAFDVQLAKKLMDKNNDGKCDYCGMDVDLCIDSGMLECTMNPEAKIGILGSNHIHTDFKVFLNGEMINFNDGKYFVKSAFAHVEQEGNSEETGNVLHIHADGVPLWLFFESLDMDLDSSRLFVNGEEENIDTYVPKSLDKILITTSNDEKIKQELDLITDYSKNH